MKVKLLNKKDTDKPQETKQKEKTPLNEGTVEEIKKERNIFQIPGFQQFNTLRKLRIIISLIFFLCTLAILLIFVTDFFYPAFLLILSYILLFMFMIKLFMTKKL